MSYRNRISQQRNKLPDQQSCRIAFKSAEDRLIANNAHRVHKIKGRSNGKWAHYFIYVPEHRERLFLAKLNSGDSINLDDYGTIIASEWGEAASAETVNTLNKRFGWNITATTGDEDD